MKEYVIFFISENFIHNFISNIKVDYKLDLELTKQPGNVNKIRNFVNLSIFTRITRKYDLRVKSNKVQID